MTTKNKLELTWVGKDVHPRLEPRILLEAPSLSHHAATRREGDHFANRLIQGDNLLALKALEQEYAGKVKCVFIDPPYNTGSAFEHYDDGLEHSLWLTMARDRLQLIHRLVANDGSLWVTLDDNEVHYFKVICDEIFGRQNFVSNVVWQKKFQPQANAIGLSNSHDHVLLYAKNASIWRPHLLGRSPEATGRYKNPDKDARGPWMSDNCTISLTGGQRGAQYAKTGFSANIYTISTPSGRTVSPPPGTCWRYSEERFRELVADNRISFGPTGENVPRYKRFLTEVQAGVVPRTWWTREDAGDNQEAKREVMRFNSKNVFSTPNPERLVKMVLDIATSPGDLVLDSFAGSGTTGAVAHKMGRRWIMVELGDHAQTHIAPRLNKVIDGADPGGVTKAVDWKGGGGYRFYRLAPSLLEKDKWGREVISRAYNREMLAAAVCKLEGFTYAPSEIDYWRHGHSTERDFIWVTTQTLTSEMLESLSEDVGPERSLLVLCAAYRGATDRFTNLTVRKIPDHVRMRCEWGRDDYSLKVDALPMAAPDLGPAQTDLFAEDEA